MTVTTKSLTAEDLWLVGEDARFELWNGELHEIPPPGGLHGSTASAIGSLLWLHVRPGRLGTVFAAETGFTVDADEKIVLGPDSAFISARRLDPRAVPTKYVPMAPDLAVEVLSPTNTRAEMREKTRLYFAAGTSLVWIIDPEKRTVQVLTPGGARLLSVDDRLDGGEVLPGFVVPIAELFD